MKRLLFGRGFMDKLYVYNLRFAWIFTVACFFLTAISGEKWLDIEDLSILGTGLQVVWAELGIHTGFMVWKAKAENCRKFKDYSAMAESQNDS